MSGPLRLTPDLLLRAYAEGLFPMAESRDNPRLHWLSPARRGVLPLVDFHIPRRLARTFRSGRYRLAVDTAPRRLIRLCAEARAETWINAEIESLYGDLADAGAVHSVEVWQDEQDAQEGQGAPQDTTSTLVGGLYGVALGGAFFGESMVSLARDASKLALVELVARLRLGGFVLFDVQFSSPHLSTFGVVEVSRDTYHARLETALATPAQFPKLPDAAARAAVLDAMFARTPPPEGAGNTTRD